MPVSADHLKELDELLRGHKFFVQLGENKQILAALNELSDDPKLREQFEESNQYIHDYIKLKQISLPAGASVSFREKSPFEISIKIETDHHVFTAGFNS